MKPTFARVFLLAAFCLTSVAQAQWQWINKDGRKVYSDLPPPGSVPDHKIQKRPGQLRGAPEAASTAAAGADAAPTPADRATAVPASAAGVDPALMVKKKKAEEEEAARRKAEESKAARVRADNCARAKQAKTTLDSGRRLSRVNEQGETIILDDAARAAELIRVQGVIASECK